MPIFYRRCLKHVKCFDVFELQTSFWNPPGVAAPKTIDRQKKLLELLDRSRKCGTSDKLSFFVGETLVCESSLLILLDLLDSQSLVLSGGE